MLASAVSMLAMVKASAQQVTPTTSDSVVTSPDHGKIHLEERMASRHATHMLDYAEKLGMGTQKYVLITIE